MTDAEYLSWLEAGGVRVALVEVSTSTPRYLSTLPFTTLPTDTPANRAYLPVVAYSFAFTERLNLDGAASISAGALELHNEDGALDSWLNEVWVNRAVRVYIGDVSWSRNDFKLVFDGVAAELTVSSSTRLSIVLRNKLERLNTPVSDVLLGGSTSNSERLLPITLGECHNVAPLLTDPATHEYQFNIGDSERVIEVRDEGVPVLFTATLTTGKFKLSASPKGAITASVQGAKPYSPTIAALVQKLATEYGTPSERLTLSDLDVANLAAFSVTCPQSVGVYLGDRANVLQTCQELASSVGAQVVMSKQGLLRLVRLAVPGFGTPQIVEPKDYEHGSLTLADRSEVRAGVKLGYCKNWSPQQSLETGIPAEHRSLYDQEWLTVTSSDSTVAANYKLYGELPQTDTLLLATADAQAEAARRLALWKQQRNVYKFRGYAHLLLLELGQALTLKGYRFGLEDGVTGTVIGLQSDWIAGRVEVEVLV